MKPAKNRTIPFAVLKEDLYPGMPALLARLKIKSGAFLACDGLEGSAEEVILHIYEQEKAFLNPRAVFNLQEFASRGHNQEIFLPAREILLSIPVVHKNITGTGLGAFFVVSLGSRMDERIKALNQEGKITYSYILDGIASEACERAVELLQSFLSRALGVAGRRFSPGYPGWELKAQSQIFALLGAEAVSTETGVVLTEAFYMQPEKSISGLMLFGCEP